MSTHEKTKRLHVLSAIFAAAVIGLLVWRHNITVHWGVIAGTVTVWGGGGMALRTHDETWGKERRYVDWWSVPHFLGGVILAMFGIGLVWVAGLAIAWEGIELATNVEEYPTNRVCDIVLAVAGWALVNALVGGGYPLT